jgi:hypothetical protein
MAEKCMFICDACYMEYKDVLHIEQKNNYRKEKCAFCEQNRDCKYSRVIYGKKSV